MRSPRWLFIALWLLVRMAAAEVPRLVEYRGAILLDEVPYEGAGAFKFALIDAASGATLWSNDGTSVLGSEPAAAVPLTVAAGQYRVVLGDTSLANMTALPPTAFHGAEVRVRTWFAGQGVASQQVEPDRRLTAVAYAVVAGTVPDGSITTEKLADGAVRGAKLGPLDAASITMGTIASERLPGVALASRNLADLSSPAAARDNLDLLEPRRGLAQTNATLLSRRYPLKVALAGDSVIEMKRYAMERALRSSFGLAGYGVGWLTGTVAGQGRTVVDGFEIWPSGVYYQLLEGDTATFSYDGVGAVIGDTVKVYFVKAPQAGALGVQLSADDAPFADVTGFTNVPAAAATVSGSVLTISRPAAARLKLRLLAKAGAVRVIGCAIYRRNYEGAVLCNLAQGGINLDTMVTSAPAIVQPIMADGAPDLVFFEMKDDAATMGRYLETYRQLIAPTADWVFIGSSPYGVDTGNLQLPANAFLRGYAEAKGLTFWDSYPLFQSGPAALAAGLLNEDGVHLNPSGHELSVSAMFTQLGLGHLATAGSQDGRRLTSTTLRSLEGDGILTISSPTNFGRGVVFQNENGAAAGGLFSLAENNTFLPGGLLLNSGPYLAMAISTEGRFSLGFRPPPPRFASFDFNLANVFLPGVTLVASGPTMQADFLQFRFSDGRMPFRVDREGGLAVSGYVNLNGVPGVEGYGLRLNGSALEYRDGGTGWTPLKTPVGDLQGRAVSTSLPVEGDSLRWNSGLQQWQPASPAGSVMLAGRTLWADATTGNDQAAARGRQDRPFRTLGAAKAAALAGDTVIVAPGLYDERDLLRHGVSWLFLPGAEIGYTGGAGAIWDDSAEGAHEAVVCRIEGAGVFAHRGAGNEAWTFKLTHPGSKVTVRAAVVSGSAAAISMTDGQASFQVEEVRTSSGDTFVVNHRGGVLEIREARLAGVTAQALVGCQGKAGVVRLRRCTLVNGSKSPAAACVLAGSRACVLDHCTLIAGPNSPFSVRALGAGARVKSYLCMANRGLQRGVTDEVGPLRVSPRVSE